MATKKRSKTTEDENLSIQLGIRVTPTDADRLTALADRFPLATRNAIARAALAIGLGAIEENPLILLGEAPKKKRGKA
jgi:hypothetical protein